MNKIGYLISNKLASYLSSMELFGAHLERKKMSIKIKKRKKLSEILE